jgi:1-acyl-sn-glycerol-3-phosphate acyltransferase
VPRVLLTLPLVALAMLAFGVASVAAGLADRSGGLARRVARVWGRTLLRLWGLQVSVVGAHNLPAGPAVYAANHVSAVDIPLLFGFLPVDFRIIHKRSLYYVPLVGQFLFLGGHVGIDRGNPFRARRSLEAAATRIAGGTSVAVFPEGTRSPDEAVRPFKKGSFLVALQAAVPVVPVSLAGVKRLVPRGLLSLRPGTVRLVIHPALPTAGRAADDADVLAGAVERVVRMGCDTGEPA